MVHLITGYKGYEHIKSADQGRFNSSFFGASEYVTESGNQCKAQYIDNNTIRILDGDILMQGRHISIEPNSYEDLTIATGTAGYKRADLIVMTYTESEADGIEDAYLEVIQGTETTGTATLPSYTSGNILEGATFNQMPLYRVDINGVTLSQTITPLFKTIPTYATLAERYEQEFISACESHLNSLNILDSMSEVNANTLANQLAGALALKEYTSHTHDGRYYTETEVDTKLATKQASITGGATTIASSDLTANRALIANANGKVAVSPVTSTELGYLDGVTGAIQTQLNNKQETLLRPFYCLEYQADSDDDLDNYTTTGFLNIGASLPKNAPSGCGIYSFLLVFEKWGDFVLQVIFDGDDIYFRTKSGSPATWGNWQSTRPPSHLTTGTLSSSASVSGGESKTLTMDASKSGYHIVGLAGFNAGSESLSVSRVTFSGNTVTMVIKNTDSSGFVDVKPSVTVLYCKD